MTNADRGLHKVSAVIDPPPTTFVLACAAFGISFTTLTQQAMHKRHQETILVCWASIGVLLSIAGYFYGVPLVASLCRLEPAMLLCGQLASVLMESLLVKKQREHAPFPDDAPQDKC